MRPGQTEFSRLREKAGLTIDEAADLLAISRRTAYRYETGESQPNRLAKRTLKEKATCRQQPAGRGFSFIDLFAGIGGMRKGFEAIGGKCVFTSEWDRWSRETYAANFPVDHEFAGDIREFTKDEESLARIPRHDVLLAGFPCQPFSIAGVSKKNALRRPHGFMCDTQGTLFYDLAEIIAFHRPPAFLLENVRNLESHDKGRTFATIRNVLENELHYHVHYRVISSEPWVPQKRERIFIVGFREPADFDFDRLEKPFGQQPKLGDILQSPAEVPAKYTLTEHLWNYLQAYKRKHASQGNGFGYSVFGPNDVTRTLSARYYKDGSEVLVEQPGHRPRRLTPRECARLMGFDAPSGEEYHIPVSDTQAYRQFGNAVVVPVVEAVARLMQPCIQTAISRNENTVIPFRRVNRNLHTEQVAHG